MPAAKHKPAGKAPAKHTPAPAKPQPREPADAQPRLSTALVHRAVRGR